MDKNYLTTIVNNNKNTLSCPLSPTIITIESDNLHIYEIDRHLIERGSTNVLTDLPGSRNLEETDENELPFPGFVETVFYSLKQTRIPRYQCLQLITWPWFERISMFVILLNCITLGMYQPCEHHSGLQTSKKCDTPRCIWLQATDYFIFAFFTIEMCIKMIAMGIFGKGTYLADTWNRLDCFIVISGLCDGLKCVLRMSRYGNQYLQLKQPWAKCKGSDADRRDAEISITLALNLVYLLSLVLQPFMPTTSDEIRQQLNIKETVYGLENAFRCYLPAGHTIEQARLLFRRIEKPLVDEYLLRFVGRKK
ncbi:unnamed protein product [Rotaria sp. Silwood2]|nr:unnamed protein product [Rotaria sp. Silwood2]